MHYKFLALVLVLVLASPASGADAPAAGFLASMAAMCGNACAPASRDGCSCRFMSATTTHVPECSPCMEIVSA